jgi:hypothetical protein
MIADIELLYGPVFTAKIAQVNSFFEEVADSLTFKGAHDTPIGNLVTDAFRATTHTQIAMEVGGSTAEPLYPGPIVGADAFRVVGYGFNTVNGLGYRLVTFDLAGAALMAGLEFGLSSIEQDDEFLVQVSGMKYTYDSGKDPFSRIVSVAVGGQVLNPLAMYTITANEFVPMFLDKLGIPYANAHICGDTTEFSALAGYVQHLGTLTPTVEGRVYNGIAVGIAPRSGEGIPKTFDLGQNYPNPFNPSTVIQYTVGGNRAEGIGVSDVSLIVYDVLGREVAVLVNERKRPGTYQVSFDGGSQASGVYFYKLIARQTDGGQAGSFSAVKRMLLLK